MAKRILILGGTGVFGKRLARHLARTEGIELFVSSRSQAKAERFAQDLQSEFPSIMVSGVAIERDTSLADHLTAIKPFAVVDCSGPFQSTDYSAARAVVETGAHFIDLADAREYLTGFSSALDAVARENGVTALTGASSTPALSTSVVSELVQGWQRVDAIQIAITPGGKSEVGTSVIEAILSYAGRPITVWRDGGVAKVSGWVGAEIVDVPHLGRRRVAPVATMDAELLGERFEVTSSVGFYAGLESGIEQRGIETIAALRKWGLFPDPTVLTALLINARKITRLPTSDRGGMLVVARGLDATGRFTQSTWSLLARLDHGPFVPILPAAAVLQKLLAGDVRPGARLALEDVSLPQILDEMEPHDIKTHRDDICVEESVFARILGISYVELPPAVRAFHDQDAPPIWSGEAEIERGGGFLARVIAHMFGFPASGSSVPLTVSVDRKISKSGEPVERWRRVFGDGGMISVLRKGPDGGLTESFPPFTFALDLHKDGQTLIFPVSRWFIGSVPLPTFLAPRSDAREYEDAQGRFRFDVRLSHPMFGLLAHYKGWLAPA